MICAAFCHTSPSHPSTQICQGSQTGIGGQVFSRKHKKRIFHVPSEKRKGEGNPSANRPLIGIAGGPITAVTTGSAASQTPAKGQPKIRQGKTSFTAAHGKTGAAARGRRPRGRPAPLRRGRAAGRAFGARRDPLLPATAAAPRETKPIGGEIISAGRSNGRRSEVSALSPSHSEPATQPAPATHRV